MSHQLTNCPESLRLCPPLPHGRQFRTNGTENGQSRIFCAFAFAAITVLAVAGVASAGEYHSNPWLLSWIPATCCVTNDCCWEVSERELRSLPGDEWEVRSTGQVRKRTAWSPDGKFYRCACDYDSSGRHWIKHQGANTRCIFVPMRSAEASPGG